MIWVKFVERIVFTFTDIGCKRFLRILFFGRIRSPIEVNEFGEKWVRASRKIWRIREV